MEKNISASISYWWIFLLTGVLLVGVGIWVFLSPLAAYLSLSILFAAGMLITGCFEIAFAVSARKSLHGWSWTLAGGILDLIIGVYLLIYPSVSMSVLSLILGFWLLIRGGSAIGLAFEMKLYKAPDWSWLLVLGILIALFGIMVLAVPAFGVANIIVWTALSFIIAGIFRITLALRLKKLEKQP
ncbi:MAG: DUF308 domain-containing protein [Agriterribacter sp.]